MRVLLTLILFCNPLMSQEYDESGTDQSEDVKNYLREIQDENQLEEDMRNAVYDRKKDVFGTRSKKDLSQYEVRKETLEEKAARIKMEARKSSSSGKGEKKLKGYYALPKESLEDKANRLRAEARRERLYEENRTKKKRGFKCPPEVPDCLVRAKTIEEKISEAASDEVNASKYKVEQPRDPVKKYGVGGNYGSQGLGTYNKPEESAVKIEVISNQSVNERAVKELNEIQEAKLSAKNRVRRKIEVIKQESTEEKAARIRRELSGEGHETERGSSELQ